MTLDFEDYNLQITVHGVYESVSLRPLGENHEHGFRVQGLQGLGSEVRD